MIDSKYFEKVVAVIMTIAVVICLLGVYFSDILAAQLDDTGITMSYETKLFDTSNPIDINIEISEDDWNSMLKNAIDEEYYSCNVEVNGTDFVDVGIRTKGNTSLSNIANDDTTDRYSFKLEFDRYVEAQTCFGLDKLVLNNNYADATNMKEAIVYDMFEFLDADASLYNYAKVSVNGEYWGVYLALEAVEDSFQLRNYGVSDGNLYKPECNDMQKKDDDNMAQSEDGQMQKPDRENMQQPEDGQMQKPNGEDMQQPDGQNMPQAPDGQMQALNGEDMQQSQEGNNDMQMPGGGKMQQHGGGMMSGNGCDLNYIDDDVDSYSSIWEGEINSTGKKDHERVVEALKNISEGNDLETYMDVDNVLKYLAVHTFAVNLDSLSGSMAHNYYLYEEDGQLNMIPWDYNLAWGGFQSNGQNGASETINFAIDTPFSSGISLEDREFFAALLENEEYLEKYHSYLQMLCDEYVNGGRLETVYNRIRSQIDTLVETDPTAFYTYDEYNTAAETLYQVLELRAESVSGQLEGTIPSTNEGQSEDSSSLIDASGINLSVMGTMQGGGMQGNMSERNSQNENRQDIDTQTSATKNGNEDNKDTQSSEVQDSTL